MHDLIGATAKKSEDLKIQAKDSRAMSRKLSRELARLYDTLAKVKQENERVLSKIADQQALNDKLDMALKVDVVL